MPLFEYRCTHCGTEFERRLKFEERLGPQTCSQCGQADAELRLSSPAPLAARAAATPARACPSTGMPCGCALN